MMTILLLASCSLSPGLERPDRPLPMKQSARTTTTPIPTIPIPEDRVFWGAYDPQNEFGDLPLDVEQEFISWENTAKMYDFLQQCQHKRRIPMITVEPTTTISGDMRRLLIDTGRIVKGQAANDAIIQKNAMAISSISPQVVLIRFGHEMDLVGNSPWASEDNWSYIAAFRHYHDVFTHLGVTNVKWIWSPAGNNNALDYYPGDSYVDFIGVTVLGHEAWDMKCGEPKGRSFSSIFKERHQIVSPLGKPIIVAELGVAPSPQRKDGDEYRRQWLEETYDSLSSYPLLAGMIYFNSMNAPANEDWGQPDWRINPQILRCFSQDR